MMPARHFQLFFSLTLLTFTLLPSPIHSGPTGVESALARREGDNNPPNKVGSPAPILEGGSAYSADAVRATKYLPAQIGAIVAAYGLSLLLVAITLLSLAKMRREHLRLGKNEVESQESKSLFDSESPIDGHNPFPARNPPGEVVENISHPSLMRTHFRQQPHPPLASPTSTSNLPGIIPSVTRSAVSADNQMAQSQLDEIYKAVMEQEDATQRGIVSESEMPVIPGASQRISSSDNSGPSPRKDRAKPAFLNLSTATHDNKTQSRTSSFLALLRKKQVKGVSISAPIMTPQSRTFPRHELQEMSAIPPRKYAPLPPPPIPTDQIPLGSQVRKSGAPSTSSRSPESIHSIGERIDTQLSLSKVPHTVPEVNAVSETPLVGPSLPSSPKPGAAFSGANAPSAVRAGGNLPLRAYEPAASSSSATSHTTKQTVFERRGPLSPTIGRTPMTAGAVPYSPYQPFTPLIPVTPSLVTKEDRKRMRKMVPKTPTMEMVKGSDELW